MHVRLNVILLTICRIWKVVLLFGMALPAFGQDGPIRDVNQIGWLVYQGDHQVSKNWTIHTEYQWRRVNFGRQWQQSLARVGAGYSLSDKITLNAGYTNLITFPYGAYPKADAGKPNPEHRLYEDIELDDTTGVAAFNHRLRLEQRWNGQWQETATGRQLGWEYGNRIRYRFQTTLPLGSRTLDDGGFYGTAYDEIFVSFGRNVGRDWFDQNRIFAALGYAFTESFRLEAGYLYQISRHSEPEPQTGSTVYEHNRGLLVNLYIDLDFTR